jgi:hypothetical protein
MYIFRTGFVNAKLLFLQHNHICNLQLLEIIENGLHLFFDTMSNIGSNCMIDIMVSSLIMNMGKFLLSPTSVRKTNDLLVRLV